LTTEFAEHTENKTRPGWVISGNSVVMDRGARAASDLQARHASVQIGPGRLH
jgi:hypothetical protein